MRWLRTFLRDHINPNSNMTIDILVDEQNKPVERVPFNGWWGKLGSTDVLYFTILGNRKVDFGSDANTDQVDRFGSIDLWSRSIQVGTIIQYADSTGEYELHVESARDLTEGGF